MSRRRHVALLPRARGVSAVEAIIWDWNGTLLDDVDLCLAIVNEILAEHGVPALTPGRYREIFDFPVRLYWERAGLDLERVDFTGVSARFCDRFEARLHRATLRRGSDRALRSIRDAGVRQYLLSNTEQAALSRMTDRYGISHHFDAVRGMPDGLAEGKLSAGAEIVRGFALDRARTLVIGDTTHDAELARSLGVDCLLLASGHQAAGRLSLGGFPVLDSFDGLCAMLLPREHP